MTIEKKIDGETIVLVPNDKISSNSAIELEKELTQALDEYKEVILDFANVPYMSSAGLRVLLLGQKKAKANNASFKLKNVSDLINDVLEATGFLDFIEVI